MSTEEIINYLMLQEKNIKYYKEKIEELEKQIEHIKQPSSVNTINLHLDKEQYTKEEIISAYNKMLKYEGLDKRAGSLITNTMFDFLDNKHHSLNRS